MSVTTILQAISVSILLLGCGETQSRENPTSAVGTDLTPQGPTYERYLYWLDGADIFRGQCTEGEPLLRATCQTDIYSAPYQTFVDALDGGLSATIAALRLKITRLTRVISRVENGIADIRRAITTEEERLGETNADLIAARNRMQDLEDIVIEFRAQLGFIDVELSRYLDPDLREQRGFIAQQLNAHRQELAEVYLRVPELLRQISEFEENLRNLNLRIEILEQRLDVLSRRMERSIEALALALREFDVFQNTLYKIEHQIIYLVTSDNDWFTLNRPYVERFLAIFESVARP
jgi:predicted  nucleic acid-binding Zn-ribbon protein